MSIMDRQLLRQIISVMNKEVQDWSQLHYLVDMNLFSNENINMGVSREIIFQNYVVHFSILIHVLS